MEPSLKAKKMQFLKNKIREKELVSWDNENIEKNSTRRRGAVRC